MAPLRIGISPRVLTGTQNFSTATRALAPHPTPQLNQSTITSTAENPTATTTTTTTTTTPAAPLARFPTSSLLRGLLLHSVSASPRLLGLGTKFLTGQISRVDTNKPLKWVLDKTFYSHFCAGSTPQEIARTIQSLRDLGVTGIILSYAREVELNGADAPSSASSQSAQIAQWYDGTLKTISYTAPGDYVAIKYSGAGAATLPLLHAGKPCFEIPQLGKALLGICEAAKKKGVRVLVDAEQSAVQGGVDGWTVSLMRRFNTKDLAVVFNTYQMYLRRSPQTLREHVKIAEREGWRLGVKLVRGAYLASDPREDIWASKEETDVAYDEAAGFLLRRERPVDLVVASHNTGSILKAREVRREVVRERKGGKGELGELGYAQLMGMADELSMSLVGGGDGKVYKYAVWGTTGECVKYLVRRAEENKDAVGRSGDNRRAVLDELKRRRWGLA